MKRRETRFDHGNKLWLQSVGMYLNQTKTFFSEEEYNGIIGAIRARDILSVVRKVTALPITEYGDVIEYYIRKQLYTLVSKRDFTRVPEVGRFYQPRLAAMKKFKAAEHKCRRVNARFRGRRVHERSEYRFLMDDMRKFIRYVLGETPNLKDIYSECDFGPGASVGIPSNEANMGRKLSAPSWSCSRTALSYAIPALYHNPHMASVLLGLGHVRYMDYQLFRELVMSKIALVEHNNIAFVPKSYKTFRSIAVEPLLNGFLQKGIDQVMRRKLLRVGVDLSNQVLNQDLAKEGSITGEYSTIDLASASDSISIELVRELLPPDWFHLLDNVRSRRYRLGGQCFTYEKFVSMGNGFCFPLQTLIFKSVLFAVSRETGSRDPSRVYGDDIVVNKSDSLLVLEVLRFLGFTANRDKTFVTGRFRESCGTDWYGGLAVRPVYFNDEVSDIRQLFAMHNITLRTPWSFLFENIRGLIRAMCPERFLFMRPCYGSPDSAFEVEKDLFMSCKSARWEGNWCWSWKELVTIPIRDRLQDLNPLLCNTLEYLAVLKGSPSTSPLSKRGNPRAKIRRVSYFGSRTSWVLEHGRWLVKTS